MSGAGAGWCVTGRWPERHEAGAWLAKLGPADAPTCWLSCGYTSGWLSGTLDANVIAVEHACAGCGEGECAFVAREVDAWEQAASAAAASPATLAFLDIVSGIDLDVYRALALRSPSGPRPDMIESEGEFEPDAPLVHIWGPVMIMPFTNADELLRTTEALSRDVGIREIRAVVIDLRDRMIDEAFDAAAIERAIETVEAWSAEPILTGVAPLAEPVVAGLEAGHLIVRKDLSEAIAAAFLIAEVQRHAAERARGPRRAGQRRDVLRPGEQAGAGMPDGARLAMHDIAGLNHLAAEGLADGLVAQAYAKQRYARLCRRPGQAKADAGLIRIARAGREEDARRAHRHRLVDRDRIVADHAGLGAQFTQVVHQVVGEGIIVIDQQQHGAFAQ